MAKGNQPIYLIRKAVVDTGPLFNVLAIIFVRNSPTHRHSGFERVFGEADYLYDPVKERKLPELFDSIQEILTTSHVIGELAGRRKVSRLSPREFWLSSVDYFARKQLDEKLLRLIEICVSDEGRESVSEIDSTDAGLIELARREECYLLTDDRKLAQRAWKLSMGDQCKLVRYLL
jgi:rRNA-processing protein FCF1